MNFACKPVSHFLPSQGSKRIKRKITDAAKTSSCLGRQKIVLRGHSYEV